MLVLSRKTDQTIVLGSDIVVTVVAVQGNRVKIGIKAPNDVRILRGELPGTTSEFTEYASISLDTMDEDMLHSSAAVSVPK